MPSTRTRQDAAFWEITKDLTWRLDDSGGGHPPIEGDEFYKGGGGGAWPKWATHLIAFLLGGLTWGTLLIAPPALPVVALGTLLVFVAVAVRRRWR